jgi:predicted dehydrogenase
MTTSSSITRVGIIGCGRNGMGHALQFSGMAEAKVVAGMDVSQERIRMLEETYPGARGYDDYQAMLDTENLDMVCISSIHSAHYEQAMAALRAGCHVLLEKPMAIEEAHCRELVRLAEETGLILQVGFECRESWLYRRVKEIIATGELGKLLSMTYTHYRGRFPEPWYRKRATGGSLSVVETCHYIDLMRFWADDDVEWVFATGPGQNMRTEYDYPDTEFVQLKFKGGMVASLTDSHARSADILPDANDATYGTMEGSYMDPVFGHQFEYTIIGEKRSLWVRMMSKQISVFERQPDKDDGMAMIRIEDYGRQKIGDLVHDSKTEDIAFLENVRSGSQSTITPDDALRTHLVTFAIERSVATEEKVVIEY